MFPAALLTTARTWEQPKRPWMEEWVKEKWYVFTLDYYSAMRRMK